MVTCYVDYFYNRISLAIRMRQTNMQYPHENADWTETPVTCNSPCFDASYLLEEDVVIWIIGEDPTCTFPSATVE